MKRRGVLGLGLLIGFVGRASAQTAETADLKPTDKIAADVTDALFRAADNVIQAFKGLPSQEFAFSVADAATRVGKVLSAYSASDLFLRSIVVDTSLLNRAASSPLAEEATELLRIAYEDLQPKLAFFASPASAASGEDIRVIVSTVERGEPKSGLTVWFNMLGLPNDRPPFRVFNDLSTPTESRIPPGAYVAYAMGQNDSLWLKRQVTIDGTVNPQNVTLAVV